MPLHLPSVRPSLDRAPSLDDFTSVLDLKARRDDAPQPLEGPRVYYEGRLDGRLDEFQRFVRGPGFFQAWGELSDAIGSIWTAAKALPLKDPLAAERALSGLSDDIRDESGRLAQSAYLPQIYGNGKRDLERIAQLVADSRLSEAQRAAEVDELVDGLAFCATRVVQVIRDTRHALERAGGGVCAEAAQTRADMQRACITDLVRRELRGPVGDRHLPAGYEMHFVSLLASRLGLQSEEELGPDTYLGGRTRLTDELVERCRLELKDKVTPVSIARVMASQALETLRSQLDEVLHDEPLDLNADGHRAMFMTFKRALEQRLGPLPDASLVRIDIMSGETLGLQRDTTLLAHALLNNLETAGALPPSTPVRLLGWRDDGDQRELLKLREGLVVLRTNDDATFDMPPDWAALQRLDELQQERPHGVTPPAALPVTTREAIALSAMADASDEALQALAPHWIVSPEVSGQLLRRLGGESLATWIHAHPKAQERLPRDMLAVAGAREGQQSVLDALHWARDDARLAKASWLDTDGHAHLHAALQQGNLALARPWIHLLAQASPRMESRDFLSAVLGRHANGQPLLMVAMGEGQVAECHARLQFILHLSTLTPMSHPMLITALRGRDRASQMVESGVTVALKRGHTGVIQAYGEDISRGLRDGRIQTVIAQSLLSDQVMKRQGGPESAMAHAMAEGHDEAVAMWLRQLLAANGAGWIKPGELFDLLASDDLVGTLAAGAAVRRRTDAALPRYFHAAEEAAQRGWIKRSELVQLLHGAAHGHNLVLGELMRHSDGPALRAYLEVAHGMTARGTLTPADLMEVLYARDLYRERPLQAAMDEGNAAAVQAYLGEARAAMSQGLLSKRHLLRLFESPSDGGQPAAMAGLAQPDSLEAWLNHVIAAASDRQLSPTELRGIFKARDNLDQGLLERSLHVSDTRSTQLLLGAMSQATRHGLLTHGELFELLTREDPNRNFPMRSAVEDNRPDQVTQLAGAILKAFADGHFSATKVKEALTRSFRGSRVDLQQLLVEGRLSEVTVQAYCLALLNAVNVGALKPEDAGKLLSPVFRIPMRGSLPQLIRSTLREALDTNLLNSEQLRKIQIASRAGRLTSGAWIPERNEMTPL